MPDLTKAQKSYLRQLAEQCYEKQMARALDSLYEEFQKWKNADLSTRELNDRVERHYNGVMRELWERYERLSDPRVGVAWAVVDGVLDLDEVQEDCQPFLQGLIELYKKEK